MKYKKAKLDFVMRALIMLCVILLIIAFFDLIIHSPKQKECFESIAEEYCQEQGNEFYKSSYKSFECLDKREVEEFKFTEQEREDCIIWD